MRIKASHLIAIVCDVLVIIFIGTPNYTSYESIAWLSVALFFYLMITQYVIYKRITLFQIFMALTFIYSFGQFVLLLFGYQETLSIVRSNTSFQTKADTAVMVLRCMLLMRIGTAFVRSEKKKEKDESDLLNKDQNLYQVCRLVFPIVLIPTVISLGSDIYQSYVYGYGARITDTALMNYGFNAVYDILAEFMIPLLIALFLTKRGHESKWVYIAISFYCVFYALTGSRIKLAMLAIVLLYAQVRKFSKRVNTRKLVLLSIAGYLVLYVFTFVSIIRANGMLKADQLKDFMDATIEAEPITHILREAGWTFVVNAKTVELCRSGFINYNYGLSYLSGVNMILPNVLGLCSFANSVPGVDTLIKATLTQYGGVGSSFFAEAFLNFGEYCLLVMPLFGYLIEKISSVFDSSVENGDPWKQFLSLYAFSIIVFYVRSDTRTFLRFFCWYGVVLYIIAKEYYRHAVKKKGINLE